MKRINRYNRRRRSERKAFGFLVGIFFILAGSLLFYITGESVEESDRIGDVSFSVTKPFGDKPDGDEGMILEDPGQHLTEDCTLTLGENSKTAYIRAKICLGGLDAAQGRQLKEKLSLKSGWVYNQMDGYYYYQNPVEAGECVCFFDGLTVPDNWERSSEKVCFCMEVWMEAAELGRIKIIYDTNQKICGWTKNF